MGLMACYARRKLGPAENFQRYPEPDWEQSIVSAERAARNLGTRFEIGHDWSSNLQFGQLLRYRRFVPNDIPKKPISMAGASSNALDASASTLMTLPPFINVPLWSLSEWLLIVSDDTPNSVPWVVLAVFSELFDLS